MALTSDEVVTVAGSNPFSGGSGRRFGNIVIILAGVSALIASFTTFMSIWLQSKNYRKPLLQRYVIRILFMVPIYCAASWSSLVSLKAAFWIDPWLDVYEAFTIYAFFQLLINFIGGERALIILTHGRAPVPHLWPLNHCLAMIDISDPHTFLAIKRGILQYTWIKPMLAVATIAMKATGTYQEGYIGLLSGYFWSGLIYNISITISLYALAMFWVCMSQDLKPFRPMPKFICIKGIIFASYWQGFFLSILVWLGAIPDIPGYSQDNLAAAIQDALICFEMPFFSVLHWYAFSWHDYADDTISAARMPIRYALRDAMGTVDLIQDAKETLAGTKYGYRQFDAEDNVLAHEDSAQRAERIKQGMRYERNGKGKYWIPDPHEATSKTPLLSKITGESRVARSRSTSKSHSDAGHGSTSNGGLAEITLDDEDEELYTGARDLEFGDWNYPVITAHHATREDRLYATPGIITASTNRHLLQATTDNKKRRKSAIQAIQAKHAHKAPGTGKGKNHSSAADASAIAEDGEEGAESEDRGRSTIARIQDTIGGVVQKVEDVVGIHLTRDSSKSSHRSLLVDLVVEDFDAEELERVRARKEGSPGWNRHDAKHFVHAYPASDGEEVEEDVRQGNEPDEFDKKGNRTPGGQHAVSGGFDQGEEGEPGEVRGGKEDEMWNTRKYGKGDEKSEAKGSAEQDDFDVANNHGESPGETNTGKGKGKGKAKAKEAENGESNGSDGSKQGKWTEYPDAEENVWASPRR